MSPSLDELTETEQLVKLIVIEPYAKRLDAPKAHALSPRSLELWRQYGLDVNHIRRLGTKRADAYWVNFSTNLTGHHVGTRFLMKKWILRFSKILQVCFSVAFQLNMILMRAR